MQRIIGAVLLAVGVVLLVMGLNATHSVGEKVLEGVTGRYSDHTTWYILGGIAALVGGAALAFFGDRRLPA